MSDATAWKATFRGSFELARHGVCDTQAWNDSGSFVGAVPDDAEDWCLVWDPSLPWFLSPANRASVTVMDVVAHYDQVKLLGLALECSAAACLFPVNFARTLMVAACSGSLNCVTHLVELSVSTENIGIPHTPPWELWMWALQAASFHHHIDCVAFLANHISVHTVGGQAIRPTESAYWAAKQRYLDVLQVLHRTSVCSLSECLSECVRCNFLDGIQWARSVQLDETSSWPYDALILAAMNNHVDLVRTIHAETRCTAFAAVSVQDVVQEVVMRGHLETLRFLWEESGYVLDARSACRFAGKYGQVAIVEYLRARLPTRPELLREAASTGFFAEFTSNKREVAKRFAMFDFLRSHHCVPPNDHIKLSCNILFCQYLLRPGYTERLRAFFRDGGHWTATLLHAAIQYGHEDLVETALANGHPFVDGQMHAHAIRFGRVNIYSILMNYKIRALNHLQVPNVIYASEKVQHEVCESDVIVCLMQNIDQRRNSSSQKKQFHWMGDWIQLAVTQNWMQLLTVCLDHYAPEDDPQLICNIAAKANRPGCLRLMCARNYPLVKGPHNACATAAGLGHMECLQYMHDQRDRMSAKDVADLWTVRVLREAVANNQLDALVFVHRHYPHVGSELDWQLMCNEARQNYAHVHVWNYLHQHKDSFVHSDRTVDE